MCGIVGYIGKGSASDIIIDGLSKLEYRGYDSAGVAIHNGLNIEVEKHKGRLDVLASELEKNPIEGSLGIGHTRWATHGEPSDANSHPHLNNDKSLAVVHNGIIENYVELKEELIGEGSEFLSQTDTEVLPHLISKYNKGNLLDAVMEAVTHVRGSYAIGVISKNSPGELVAARKDSPLIVGVGKEEFFIASDIPAVLKYTRDVIFIENDEIIHIKDNKIKIYDKDKKEVEKEIFKVTWDIEAASKGGYDFYMDKEIHEQPTVIKDTIERRLNPEGDIVLDNINITKEQLKDIKKIFIVACGTAYHAGVLGKHAIEKLMRVPVIVDIASEFRYGENFVDENSLVILVSQSGETADTLAALRNAKEKGARVLSVTNVVGSSIARESDDVFYTWAGPEISVASTKAYTTQIVSLYMIALDFAIKAGTIDKETYKNIIDNMLKLPECVQSVLDKSESIKDIAKSMINKNNAFYLGRGADFSLSQEGALKLKEISYIHAEAFAAGELKHGTIALIEEGTPVVAVSTQDTLLEKMVSNVQEVKARGAFVISIAKEGNNLIEGVSDRVIYIPKISDFLAPVVAVVPMQILAYHVSALKGLDVDKPRNLAKSVTVE
ncbi:glutamine--fructose-6-phosphate transaminase (isomerizing) [Peptostreptococcus faecalis]|uniref:glutamine--fructose-6-phosphate transaminase (isomerizing) n=1 Tax=Peptostreptococcus faecalis TaxID=2045015 RepID=UPI000C7B0697